MVEKNDMIVGKHIAVWFSCGAASAVAAKLSLDKWSSTNKISILNNQIKKRTKTTKDFSETVKSGLG